MVLSRAPDDQVADVRGGEHRDRAEHETHCPTRQTSAFWIVW